MIYVSIALQAEAKPLISALNLKAKIENSSKWPIYTNEDASILLFITGMGPVASAAAISAALIKYPADDNSTLVNIGTCAAPTAEKVGDIFLINKLTDATTSRTFYPDIIKSASWGLPEKELSSSPTPVERPATLSDMEGAFIYQAASFFLRPDQIQFIKVVSDNGTGGSDLTSIKESISQVMNSQADKIAGILTGLCTTKPPQAEADLTQLFDDLHCSKTMEHQLLQLFKYASTLGLDSSRLFSELYEKELVPCASKRDGKKVLDYLSEKIIP